MAETEDTDPRTVTMAEAEAAAEPGTVTMAELGTVTMAEPGTTGTVAEAETTGPRTGPDDKELEAIVKLTWGDQARQDIFQRWTQGEPVAVVRQWIT